MLENLVYFVIGMIVSSLFSYIMGIGTSVLVLRELQRNCAALFLTSSQNLQEILELKYLVMKEADRSDQNILVQRHIDHLNIESVKETMMKNYVNSFPKKYENVMEFSTWDEMEKYVNNTVKKAGRNNDKKRKEK